MTDVIMNQLHIIFNTLPEEKRWVHNMSEDQWMDYVDEYLQNTNLCEEVRDSIMDYTSVFWMNYFPELELEWLLFLHQQGKVWICSINDLIDLIEFL